MKKDFFPALTGIRAIAAYMVYLYHVNIFYPLSNKCVSSFYGELHIGVTIFFVLSGFLITYRYFDFEKINYRNYFVNRFSRIYPMYFLLTTGSFLFYAIFKSQNNFHDLVLYLSNITFLKSFFNSIIFSGIAQGWSLTVEEFFYLLAPLFFIFIKRKYITFLLPIPVFFLGLMIVNLFKGNHFYGFMEDINFMFNYTFFGRVSEFFIGIALALFVKQNRFKLQTKFMTYLGISVVCLSVFLLSKVGHIDGDSRGSTYGKVINTFFLPIFGIAPLFWGLITEKTIISNILKSNVFILLGKSSYVFYLIHMGVYNNILYNHITHNQTILFIVLNGISIFLFLNIEEPLNLYLRKKLSKKSLVPIKH